MTFTHTSTRQSEQGFTLVELAIVMVIIGLLIGGILKGQELIANAKISSTVSQLKGVDAALNTFFDKYNGLAGDILTPATRLPGCTVAPCNTAGNGDQRYANIAGAAPARGNEGVVAFSQLSAADLVSGIDNRATGVTFGGILPTVKAGGGMWLGAANATGGATAVTARLTAFKPYAALNGTAAAVSATSGAITPGAAAQIDRKVDDGVGITGSVQSLCGGAGMAAATGIYNESLTNVTCAIYARVMN